MSRNKFHNICFITCGCVHHKYGGLDRVTEILADKFESDGNSVYYISQLNRGKYNLDRQHFLPDASNPLSYKNEKFLNDFIDKKNIDIIINQEANLNLCIPIHKRNGILVISCLHFNPDKIGKRKIFERLQNSNRLLRLAAHVIYWIKPLNNMAIKRFKQTQNNIYKANFEWCDRMVLLSEKFIEPMRRLLDNPDTAEKLSAINNPCQCEATEVDFEKKSNTILFVGRIDNDTKRIDELLEEISPILQRHSGWKFTLCGDGPDRNRLERKYKSDKIEFTGYKNPNEFYKDASIIVLKSTTEGWGMVLVEAMNHGVVPVVANTYASLSDIIDSGRDGYITENNSEDFISRLEYLINNRNLRIEMGENALEKVRKFDINNIAYQWYELFELWKMTGYPHLKS